MAGPERLFMRMFDRRAANQLAEQAECYDRALASYLLLQGIEPPPWLWSFDLDEHIADFRELKLGALFPRQQELVGQGLNVSEANIDPADQSLLGIQRSRSRQKAFELRNSSSRKNKPQREEEDGEPSRKRSGSGRMIQSLISPLQITDLDKKCDMEEFLGRSCHSSAIQAQHSHCTSDCLESVGRRELGNASDIIEQLNSQHVLLQESAQTYEVSHLIEVADAAIQQARIDVEATISVLSPERAIQPVANSDAPTFEKKSAVGSLSDNGAYGVSNQLCLDNMEKCIVNNAQDMSVSLSVKNDSGQDLCLSVERNFSSLKIGTRFEEKIVEENKFVQQSPKPWKISNADLSSEEIADTAIQQAQTNVEASICVLPQGRATQLVANSDAATIEKKSALGSLSDNGTYCVSKQLCFDNMEKCILNRAPDMSFSLSVKNDSVQDSLLLMERRLSPLEIGTRLQEKNLDENKWVQQSPKPGEISNSVSSLKECMSEKVYFDNMEKCILNIAPDMDFSLSLKNDSVQDPSLLMERRLSPLEIGTRLEEKNLDESTWVQQSPKPWEISNSVSSSKECMSEQVSLGSMEKFIFDSVDKKLSCLVEEDAQLCRGLSVNKKNISTEGEKRSDTAEEIFLEKNFRPINIVDEEDSPFVGKRSYVDDDEPNLVGDRQIYSDVAQSALRKVSLMETENMNDVTEGKVVEEREVRESLKLLVPSYSFLSSKECLCKSPCYHRMEEVDILNEDSDKDIHLTVGDAEPLSVVTLNEKSSTKEVEGGRSCEEGTMLGIGDDGLLENSVLELTHSRSSSKDGFDRKFSNNPYDEFAAAQVTSYDLLGVRKSMEPEMAVGTPYWNGIVLLTDEQPLQSTDECSKLETNPALGEDGILSKAFVDGISEMNHLLTTEESAQHYQESKLLELHSSNQGSNKDMRIQEVAGLSTLPITDPVTPLSVDKSETHKFPFSSRSLSDEQRNYKKNSPGSWPVVGNSKVQNEGSSDSVLLTNEQTSPRGDKSSDLETTQDSGEDGRSKNEESVQHHQASRFLELHSSNYKSDLDMNIQEGANVPTLTEIDPVTPLSVGECEMQKFPSSSRSLSDEQRNFKENSPAFWPVMGNSDVQNERSSGDFWHDMKSSKDKRHSDENVESGNAYVASETNHNSQASVDFLKKIGIGYFSDMKEIMSSSASMGYTIQRESNTEEESSYHGHLASLISSDGLEVFPDVKWPTLEAFTGCEAPENSVSFLDPLSNLMHLSAPVLRSTKHTLPTPYFSLPSGLLEQMTSSANAGAKAEHILSLDGIDLSDSFPNFGAVEAYMQGGHHSYTPPMGKLSSKSAGSNREKRFSSSSEFTCFPIDEDTCISEGDGRLEEATCSLDEASPRSGKHASGIRNALADVTLEGSEHPEEAMCSSDEASRRSEKYASNIRNALADVTLGTNISSSVDLGVRGSVDPVKRNRYHVTQIGVRKHGKTQGRDMTFVDGKENACSFEGNGLRRNTRSYAKEVERSKLSRKPSGVSSSQGFVNKRLKTNNIVSSISSFIPLVMKEKSSITTGKRDIRVKALEAAEAAKRMEEEKAKARQMRKDAAKIKKERIEQEKLEQLKIDQKKKEEEQKKKEDEAAARKRQREEEGKKEMKNKRRCNEEARKLHKEREEKIQADKKEKMLLKAMEMERKQKAAMEATKKQLKVEKVNRAGSLGELRAFTMLAADAEWICNKDEDNTNLKELSNSVEIAGELKNYSRCTEHALDTGACQEQDSYVISPYVSSDDEEEEEEEESMNLKKFIPQWGRCRESIIQNMESLERVKPYSIFLRQRCPSINELLDFS